MQQCPDDKESVEDGGYQKWTHACPRSKPQEPDKEDGIHLKNELEQMCLSEVGQRFTQGVAAMPTLYQFNVLSLGIDVSVRKTHTN